MTAATDVTIRPARPLDAGSIAHLAQLDSSRPPHGTILLAEVAGVPWAAVSVEDFHAVADPFKPTGELVALLVERARQMRGERRPRIRGRRRIFVTPRIAA